MLLDGRFSAAICALFHVMHSISGRHPSAALMRAGDGGGDGFGLRFIVADGAYLMPGTGFSGSCFFINDPFSEGVGGIINAGFCSVCGYRVGEESAAHSDISGKSAESQTESGKLVNRVELRPDPRPVSPAVEQAKRNFKSPSDFDV